jgi:hypothetical protein
MDITAELAFIIHTHLNINFVHVRIKQLLLA